MEQRLHSWKLREVFQDDVLEGPQERRRRQHHTLSPENELIILKKFPSVVPLKKDFQQRVMVPVGADTSIASHILV